MQNKSAANKQWHKNTYRQNPEYGASQLVCHKSGEIAGWNWFLETWCIRRWHDSVAVRDTQNDIQ